jgi:exopolysaccharide biosynthesis protein
MLASFAIWTLVGLQPLGFAPQIEEITGRRTDRKELADGVMYVQMNQLEPPLAVSALIIDPKKVRAESRLAGGTIYEPGATNGRGTVSQMVKEADALGGINGDFFQWTPDPGGDPQGLAIHEGKLLSIPDNRNVAFAWGPNTPWSIASPKFSIKVSTTDQSKNWTPTVINGRVPADGIGLNFAVAGQIYGPTPITVVRMAMPHRNGELSGKVRCRIHAIEPNIQRANIAKNEVVMGLSGKANDQYSGLQVGKELEIEWALTGLPKGATEAMGGWPVLLKDGTYAGPKEDDKAPRHPRSVVGMRADGKWVFAVIDGRQTKSVGTTFTETAEIMKWLGCRQALNLDGGGSSAIKFLGITLNRPSGGVERSVANGILFFPKR